MPLSELPDGAMVQAGEESFVIADGRPLMWTFGGYLGVNAPLTLPIGQLALVFVILVLLTAAAGVLPARRAAKVSPVVALGAE